LKQALDIIFGLKQNNSGIKILGIIFRKKFHHLLVDINKLNKNSTYRPFIYIHPLKLTL
jgi:hypothetical protein